MEIGSSFNFLMETFKCICLQLVRLMHYGLWNTPHYMNANVRQKTFNITVSYFCPVDHKCTNPPTPPTESNMKLLEGEYNSTSPPSHNDTVEYVCDAGPDWNRFASNFSRWSLTLTCLPDNQWSSVEWPTCLNGLCRNNIRYL